MYQGVSTVILNFESIGLKENVQNKIVNVRWTFSCYNDYGHASDYYKNETSGQTTWDCKIAIMNLSDYGYVANLKSCTSKLSEYEIEGCYSADRLFNSSGQLTTSYSYDSRMLWIGLLEVCCRYDACFSMD